MNLQRNANAALATLLILELVMLAALFTQTVPHPPTTIPLFAIAPYLAAAMACCVAAMIVLPTETWAGRVLSVLAVVFALLSYGPQKYVDPSFYLIWPAVIAGQIASLCLLYTVYLSLKKPQSAENLKSMQNAQGIRAT